MIKLNSKQLRAIDAKDIIPDAKSIVRNPIVLILENIYDTYNIGGIFRLADALGVAKIYLCGDTETPPNNRIHKASCGTYKVVPWEYCKSAEDAIEQFISNEQLPSSKKQTPLQVDGGDCVLERGTGCLSESELKKQDISHAKKGQNILKDQTSSVPSERIQLPNKPLIVAVEQSPTSIPYTSLKPAFPLALVVGNETTGVTPNTLSLCDRSVEIPMWGINKSLNVIVSAAIVSYHLMTQKGK